MSTSIRTTVKKMVIPLFALFAGVFFIMESRRTYKHPIEVVELSSLQGKDRRWVKEKRIEKAIGDENLANIDNIKKANSDKLPKRLTKGKADKFCSNSTDLFCMPAFEKFESEFRAAPQYKMSTCVIQKSMSTVMTATFCYLFDEEEFVSHNRNIYTEWKPNRFCARKNEFPKMTSMRRRLHIHGNWTFTMVTRDPIDRFLSGFVDKCIRKPQGDKPCFGCGSNMTCFLINEYHRQRDQVEKHHFWRSFEDRHFFPQNWRCDLQDYYDDYEFIRYSSDPSKSLMRDLIKILKKQKVPAKSINYIRKVLTEGRTVHSTIQSEARTFMEKRLRSSPFLMEYVIRMFYHDFKLFNYHFPPGF